MEFLFNYLEKDLETCIPLTYFIDFGNIQDQLNLIKQNFTDAANKRQNNPIFIIKPGEDSNRGNGIELSDNFADIKKLLSLKQFH